MLGVKYYYIFLVYKVEESVMVNFIKKKHLYLFVFEINGKTNSQVLAKIPLYINDVMMHIGLSPRGNFVHYDFMKLHYIRHKIKDVIPLRVAALTCNITFYTLQCTKMKYSICSDAK